MGSVIIPRSRTDTVGNAQSEFDVNTGETVQRFQAVIFDEDFLGPGHTPGSGIPTSATAGYPWIQKTVKTGGSPSVAAVSNAAGGVIRNSIDTTSEKQEASLYWADVLNFDMTKSAIFECRVKLSTLPSAAAVEMVWGLQSAWIDGPDNASFYAQFQAQASGAVNMRTKDGVNTVSKATGTTVVNTDWHNYRIDATDPTNVLFFIDGALVSANNMAFAATGSNAILQPYFSVYKASGAGQGALDIDMAQIAMNRS
jgi:hypothetical protein